uniref:Uncharacterized protein n=1 Tax=Triticum urartu TaxID=4572 RepID=A0A8R7R396_TRIUA
MPSPLYIIWQTWEPLVICNITGTLTQHLATHNIIVIHCRGRHLWTAIERIVASEPNLLSTTKETSLVSRIVVFHRPLVRESTELSFDPPSNVDKQAAEPGNLSLKRRVTL